MKKIQITYMTRDLYSEYLKLLHLNHKKTNNLFKNKKRLNRPFSKEDMQMNNKHMEKMVNISSH